MATIALSRPIPPHRPSSTSAALSSPFTPPLSLEDIESPAAATTTTPSQQTHAGDPAPVPNKHIPICPTGPARASPAATSTPPPSPKRAHEQHEPPKSLLYPPDKFRRIDCQDLSIFELDAHDVADAVDFAASQPLPDPSLVFPWFHGLHRANQLQLAFFDARGRASRKTPSCLRAVTLVKADGNVNIARLKGAIAPDEFLHPHRAEFIEADPPDGFSVRNFQIQPAKVALTSDIIVYGENLPEVKTLAWNIADAQLHWRTKFGDEAAAQLPHYGTFICTAPFEEFESQHRHIVSIDASGCHTGSIIDFVHQERREMWDMTEASEISHNVYLGPTPEPGSLDEEKFDVLIECSDSGRLDPNALQAVAKCTTASVNYPFHEFPSSGSILPPTWSHDEADGIVATCKWLYEISHGSSVPKDGVIKDTDVEGDMQMLLDGEEPLKPSPPRKVLIHCADGYTESTMLAIAYFIYSTGRTVAKAWLHLHTQMHRNFFAYPTDVALLNAIAPRLLNESPACAGRSLQDITGMVRNEPRWVAGLDGSLPSRILDYLYLGNLVHANNPELLREMGICQVLSVGETAMWRDGDLEEWGRDNVCIVENVQDNGIDPLTDEFQRCLDFIDRGRRNGTATLVHCRVGVSRSATICIAEVMRKFNLSLPRAYCFVRARRLNVIIQPHLRFAYELLRWEETLRQRSHDDGDPRPVKRELEWCEIAREIALMNRPYSR